MATLNDEQDIELRDFSAVGSVENSRQDEGSDRVDPFGTPGAPRAPRRTSSSLPAAVATPAATAPVAAAPVALPNEADATAAVAATNSARRDQMRTLVNLLLTVLGLVVIGCGAGFIGTERLAPPAPAEIGRGGFILTLIVAIVAAVLAMALNHFLGIGDAGRPIHKILVVYFWVCLVFAGGSVTGLVVVMAAWLHVDALATAHGEAIFIVALVLSGLSGVLVLALVVASAAGRLRL